MPGEAMSLAFSLPLKAAKRLASEAVKSADLPSERGSHRLHLRCYVPRNASEAFGDDAATICVSSAVQFSRLVGSFQTLLLPGKVKLLDRREDNTTDDRNKAEPLRGGGGEGRGVREYALKTGQKTGRGMCTNLE